MSKCVKRDFFVLSAKKDNSLVFGTRLVLIGFDENKMVRSFGVPFCKVYASEEISMHSCRVYLNRFGIVSRIEASPLLLKNVFSKKIFGGIL